MPPAIQSMTYRFSYMNINDFNNHVSNEKKCSLIHNKQSHAIQIVLMKLAPVSYEGTYRTLGIFNRVGEIGDLRTRSD